MAQGDVTVYSAAKRNIGDGLFNLSTGPFYLMLQKDSATDPTENDSDPGYGAGRTPNWSVTTIEVAAGGNYTAGGEQMDVTITDNWTLTGNVATFDADNITWSQNASNPTDARFAACYQNDANDYGLFFLDLGSSFDMTSGDLAVAWNASGIFTLT